MNGWRRTLRTGPAVLLLVWVVACDGGTEPEPPTVSGRWTGNTESVALELILQEQPDGNVDGGGTVTVPGTTLAITVSGGTHVFPDVTLTLSASGFQDMNLTGEVSEGAIDGRLHGSGFNDLTLELEKQ